MQKRKSVGNNYVCAKERNHSQKQRNAKNTFEKKRTKENRTQKNRNHVHKTVTCKTNRARRQENHIQNRDIQKKLTQKIEIVLKNICKKEIIH